MHYASRKIHLPGAPRNPIASFLNCAPVLPLLTCGASLLTPPQAARAAVAAAPQVSRYAKFETAFTLADQIGNPFDPAANDVDARLQTPNGQSVAVPAFWDGDRWRVRYTPSQVGAYSLTVERNGKLEHPTDLTASGFRCIPSPSPGFVRRSAKQVQAFRFDNGQPYYPLGIDVAWINSGNPSYAQYFDRMNANGMNWARVWMNNWDGKNLEWSQDKIDQQAIGTYSSKVAHYWDTIFDEADHDGIYIQMTLQHHGQYTNKTDPNWADNPFNVANGGFLKNPDDFFTDPRARALTKAKYRYIVARYGYSTHLMAFELFNEVQNIAETSSHFQDVVAWHTEMANYIRSIDPYRHLITSSNTPNDNALYKAPLDYAQIHIYTPDVVSSINAVDVASYTRPLFVGEWGQQGGAPQDHKTVEQVLFTSIATPMSGGAMFWSWDGMDQIDAWPVYASVSGFLKTDHIASLGPMKTVHAVVQTPSRSADLSITPPLGWAPSTTLDARISSTGEVSGTSGMSSFLQGTSHTDMQPRPFAFHLHAARPTSIVVKFGQVSGGGAHPVLAVAGQSGGGRQSDFPKSDKNHDADLTLTVTVPAGEQEFTLGNTGPDWITVSSITVKDYAPSVAVTARGNGRDAVFWARDRSAQAASSAAAVTLPGWSPGRYQVRLWNTRLGRPGPILPARAGANGKLTFLLHSFTSDVAGVVGPAGVASR